MKRYCVALISIALIAATHAGAATQERVTFVVDDQTLVGTLFKPDTAKPGARLPAIIVDGPWTQVKEQVGYAYGRRLADHGFAVLALDHRNYGESEGQPRQFEDPSTKVADLRGAVRFLQRTPGVDGARIHGVGVCYGASLIADAARREPGFKGIATVAAWLHDRPSLMATYTPEGYALREARGREAQAKFKETGTVEYIPAYSNDTFAAMAGPFDYYSNPSRGVIPQWSPRFATMSFEGWLKHEAAGYAREINQPVLMIHSDGSALPDNVRRFHADLPNPGKKLHWTTGDHVDFYDRAELIEPAVREIGAFFKSL